MAETAAIRSAERRSSSGAALTAMSFVMWGVLPIYWKPLVSLSAWTVLAHRIIWSLAFTSLLLTYRRRWRELPAAFGSGRDYFWVLISSMLLGGNLIAYMWGMIHGFVVECSLGYFIAPLAHTLLGCVVLKERLRFWQAASFALAAAGVLNLMVGYGRFPWIALTLAGTFALYSLFRKKSKLESLPGLAAETTLLSIPALGYLIILHQSGHGALGHASWPITLLLIGSGVVTSLPLLCFAYGARRVTLTTVGFLQYLAPMGQFLLGVFVFKEKFTSQHMITFALIWVAIAIYSWDSVRNRTREKA